MSNIIIVDDDIDFLCFLERTLSSDGHRVETAENGSDGMEVLRYWRADLLITDLAMPQTNGAELIRMSKTELPDMPVIGITGEGRPVTHGLDLARRCGADGVLGKPLDVEAFREMVSLVLKGGKPANASLDADFSEDPDAVYTFMPPNLISLKVKAGPMPEFDED